MLAIGKICNKSFQTVNNLLKCNKITTTNTTIEFNIGIEEGLEAFTDMYKIVYTGTDLILV